MNFVTFATAKWSLISYKPRNTNDLFRNGNTQINDTAEKNMLNY